MADSIGSEQFVFVEGVIDRLQRRYDGSITDPHEDGEAVRALGRHADVSTLRAGKAFANRTAGNAALATYRASLTGTVVSVTREGVAETNFLILNVREVPGTRITSPVYSGDGPGDGPHWCEFEFTGIYGAGS